MSLTPAFAPDARSHWEELDFELQELVIDELDKIALDPPHPMTGIFRRDTVRQVGNGRDYLFLRFALDDTRATLIGIHYLFVPTDARDD